MFRKFYLIILVLVVGFNTSNAQCIPDVTITIPGIYPDTATGLADATVGVLYDEDIQVRVLTDTTFNNLPVVITSITITSVVGLPPGLNYICNPTSCVFPGGSNGCAQITGTPTTAGIYPIVVNIQIDGTTFGVPLPPQNDVITGYSITVNQATGIAQIGQDPDFALLPNYPNPANEYTEIKFTTQLDGDYVIRLFDVIGREVFSRNVRALKGMNSIRVNTSGFEPGVYLIAVDNRLQRETRKMIITGR